MVDEKNIVTLTDAFRALEDVEDEEVLPMLQEGKAFNVRSTIEMQEAEEFRNEPEEETPLEVIDMDADALEHMKDNKDYIGQAILQCNTCRALIFKDLDELVPDEAVENRFNNELECPHCHSEGTGFTLVGQVGKMKEEGDEVKFSNDSLTASDDEAVFTNDLEKEPAEEEPVEEEKPAEEEVAETTEQVETAEEESTAEEDSAADEEAEDEEDEFDAELRAKAEEEEKKKNESLEESLKGIQVKDFLDKFIEPDTLEDILVFDLNNDDPENVIYSGDLAGMPKDVLESEFVSFNTGKSILTLNVDSRADLIEGEDSVASILEAFNDDFADNLMLWDDSTSEELYSGTKDTAIEAFGDFPVTSIGCPALLYISCRMPTELTEGNKQASAPVHVKEDLDLSDPTARLISDIINENKLSEYKVSRAGTVEYALAESIRTKEDLDSVYRAFVAGHSTILENDFKEVTGYDDSVVLTEAKDDLDETIARNDNEEEAIEDAKKIIADHKAFAVIYGYQKNGKFYAIDPVVVRDRDSYADKARIVSLVYKPTGSIKTLYAHSVEVAEEYESRAELSKAIKECKENNISFSVKSLGKNRYKLIKESFEEEADKEDPGIVTKAFAAGEEICGDKEVCPVCGKEVCECDKEPVEEAKEAEEFKFDLDRFTECLNEYFDSKFEETTIFEGIEAKKEDNGDITIRGVIKMADGEGPETIILSNGKLNEDIGDTVFDVTCPFVDCCLEYSTEGGLQESFFVRDNDGEEVEIVDPNEDHENLPAEQHETLPADPRDIELVNKLTRIAHDTAEAIRGTYHVEVDERLILADLIQDLKLVSGELKPEDLAHTPMNDLTREMYAAYDGFYNALDNLVSAITGERITTSQAQRLTQAIASLDSENFTKEGIEDSIATPGFLVAMRRGQIPGVRAIGRATVEEPAAEEE